MNRNTIVTLVVIVVVIIIAIVVASSYSTPTNAPEGTPVTQDSSVPVTSATPATSVVPSTSNTSSNTPLTPHTYNISYTSSGFDPAMIVIKKGDTITWTNNTSSRLWVASNPHPTHTDLPGFDEKKAVMQGGTYSYTFTTLGTHGYHNHANDDMMGTVIVE